MAATCGHARADKKTMLGLRSDTSNSGCCDREHSLIFYSILVCCHQCILIFVNSSALSCSTQMPFSSFFCCQGHWHALPLPRTVHVGMLESITLAGTQRSTQHTAIVPWSFTESAFFLDKHATPRIWMAIFVATPLIWMAIFAATPLIWMAYHCCPKRITKLFWHEMVYSHKNILTTGSRLACSWMFTLTLSTIMLGSCHPLEITRCVKLFGSVPEPKSQTHHTPQKKKTSNNSSATNLWELPCQNGEKSGLEQIILGGCRHSNI